MASSPAISNEDDNNEAGSRYAPLLPRQRPSVSSDEKVLSVSANVLQQLPTSSVMAFQALSSSFTNQGECHPSNWWLSLVLVTLLTLSCIFFSFTDSFVYQGKLWYGVAFPWGLIPFNERNRKELREVSIELKKRGLVIADYVRAFFTAAVFLAFAASDVGIQNCFFPQASFDAKQLLKNTPLGVAVLSSFVFMVCPTRRKGVDFLSSGTTVPSSSSTTIDIESQLHDPPRSGHV